MISSAVPVIKLFSLENRVALITGASGHLGQKMAEALCEAGAHVILNGRNEQKLKSVYESLKDKGYRASLWIYDITHSDTLNQEIIKIIEEYGELDILVNNAYQGKPNTLDNSRIEDFSNAYRICVEASYQLTMACLPFLKKAALKSGNHTATIINIGTMYGIVSPNPALYGDSGFNNPPYYGSAKAGLIQLTKYLACHLASHRIRVNCLSPGPFPPADLEDAQPEFYKKLCQQVPLNRIGNANELKGPLLFLASDASSFVTGINLSVDGGWTTW